MVDVVIDAPRVIIGICGAILFFVRFHACFFNVLAAHGFPLGRAYVRVPPA
jgi:hypothetical protein